MITISVKHNIGDTIRLLDDRFRKQVPFATKNALNEVVKKAQAETYREFRDKFDRPTPFTMKSLFIKYATKQNLSAMVYLKDKLAGGKARNSMAEILGHEFSGGARIQRGLEYWLQRAGLISAGEYVAPGQAAKLDQYGNMSRGQIQQIMSQLHVGGDPFSFSTSSSRSRRNAKKAGEMFWSRGGHLPRGVWMRNGASVRPILLVVSKPNYKKRIDMQAIADKVVRRDWEPEFNKALAAAIVTAR